MQQSRHGKKSMSDKQWALMAPHCLGKPGDAGPRGTDKRLFVEAVLWIVRTGSPWRDLPEEFGKCNTVFKRFRDWVKAGIWQNSLMPSAASRICNTPWSMPRS